MLDEYDEFQSVRVPPHSNDAEQSVLGGLMICGTEGSQDAWDVVAGKLLPSDFYRHDHATIFAVIAQSFKENAPVDFITISERLKDAGKLDEVGGQAYLGTLAKDVPGYANIAGYAEVVRNKSLLRQTIALAQKIQERAFSSGSDSDSVKAVIQLAAQGVFDLEQTGTANDKGFVKIKPLLSAYVKTLQARQEEGETALLGVTSGLDEFDKKTNGLEKKLIHLIAARPGMGKTTLGLNIMEAASEAGSVAAIFSIEMSAEKVVEKMVTSQGSVDFGRIRSPWLFDELDWTKVSTGMQRLANRDIYIDDPSTLTPSEVRTKLRRLIREIGKSVDVVMIDYVQKMSGDKGAYGTRDQEITDISGSLMAIAKEFDVAIVLLAQLNRGVESRTNKRPVMSDLRESGALEQDASTITFIYREEYYDKENSAVKGLAELLTEKNRSGETGPTLVRFEGVHQRFSNFEQEGWVA